MKHLTHEWRYTSNLRLQKKDNSLKKCVRHGRHHSKLSYKVYVKRKKNSKRVHNRQLLIKTRAKMQTRLITRLMLQNECHVLTPHVHAEVARSSKTATERTFNLIVLINKKSPFILLWMGFLFYIIPIETSSRPTSTLSVGFKNRIWKRYFLFEGNNTKNFKLQHHSVR